MCPFDQLRYIKLFDIEEDVGWTAGPLVIGCTITGFLSCFIFMYTMQKYRPAPFLGIVVGVSFQICNCGCGMYCVVWRKWGLVGTMLW